MIDYLVSKIKKKKINFELYFWSYEFSHFYDFFLNFYKFIWISFFILFWFKW